MHSPTIAILGAGLSGLYAATLLTQRGVREVVLLEARVRPGGRILSVPARADGAGLPGDRVDLGPSWFWPQTQPQLDALIAALGLARFEQPEDGDMRVERSLREGVLTVRGYPNWPPSMRLAGGMAALTDALLAQLPPGFLHTDRTVRVLRCNEAGVAVEAVDAAGGVHYWQVDQVLLALPPRLAARRIAFEPELPPALLRQWQATPTWMAPHAKYVAVYPTAFWREQGLSGEARSAIGPLGEIHDASTPGGSAALFGFVGVPARTRQSLAPDALRAACREQLARLFGPQAAQPLTDYLQDWAQEPCTATPADFDSAGQHAVAPPSRAGEGPWRERLIGIGSEWSRRFPGYVAGAVEAVEAGLGHASGSGRRTSAP
jgi:monoamine oxidase